MKKYITILLIISCSSLFGQGLFEDAVSKSEQNNLNYELNGFIRGTSYFGLNSDNNPDLKTGTGEACLKIFTKHDKFGKAFADIRFQNGYEFSEFSHFSAF